LLHDELRGKLGELQAQRLWRIYGCFAADVAALAARSELAAPLGGGDVLTAELVYGLTTEWAQTLEDLLQRRCMAGLAADFGLRTAPAAATALERLGFWDAARAARELADYRELATRHGAER
jgi:glycerol-3-phosphate dehydrogenase